ncbi:MAG: hypothetical protein IT445_03105 [Phycisphaeraceae bacterium]|nr:hypothetical protein [Phycisphaeraceae bacterium]
MPRKKHDDLIVIQIIRHVVRGGIRRAPGDVLVMTRHQIERQGLTKADYVVLPAK